MFSSRDEAVQYLINWGYAWCMDTGTFRNDVNSCVIVPCLSKFIIKCI